MASKVVGTLFIVLIGGTRALEFDQGLQEEARTFNLNLGGFNSSIAITGTLIIGGLFLFSALLYALDVYTTSRIDRMLVDSFGPQIYERFSDANVPQDYSGLLGGIDYENESQPFRRRRRRRSEEGSQLSPNESRVMSLINLALSFYNAADESLRVPECRKKLVCEVYSRPEDVLGEGYLGKTIKKGIEYLPYIQERYNLASEILDGKKDAEENRPCETKTATCNHLEKVLNGMTTSTGSRIQESKGVDEIQPEKSSQE